jgi:hypothetical protein
MDDLEVELRELFPQMAHLSQEAVDEIVRADAAGETYFVPYPEPVGGWQWEVVSDDLAKH